MFNRPHSRHGLVLVLLVWCGASGCVARPQAASQPAERNMVAERYTKAEYRIPMRDGVRLFTAVYSPRDTSKPHPIMLYRTPYSIAPYGADAYRPWLGLPQKLLDEGVIVVGQDVRGRFMSEGQYDHMRPEHATHTSAADIDESSDTFDTIDWLVRNVPNNNGRVGMWGISYPGFYAACGAIDSHPALKAVSPQAPIADWFIGDDEHHHGAFFLFDAFDFYTAFRPQPKPTTEWPERFDYGTPDAYQYFLDMGPLSNAGPLHFDRNPTFWNDMMEHPDNDEFWQSRNLLPHLRNVRTDVMVVGGFFDAEDLYGPLYIYKAIEQNNPGIRNCLVMGPWRHGGWVRQPHDRLGDFEFPGKPCETYQNDFEYRFFHDRLIADGPPPAPPEARVYETGSDRWLEFPQWPPAGLNERRLYFAANGGLSWQPPDGDGNAAYDEYLSDPARPVPYQEKIDIERGTSYMIADQRFAARRPDVLVYQTPPLTEDVALAGPIQAELFVSTTGSDADFVVKVIDVLPNDTPDPDPNPRDIRMGGYQRLVRAEVMRARYRNSYERPEPLTPGEVTPVSFELRDVCHVFKRGHRLMVQVQSSWFPLVDRNPQTFVNIYKAKAEDFRKATHRIHRGGAQASCIRVGVRPAA